MIHDNQSLATTRRGFLKFAGAGGLSTLAALRTRGWIAGAAADSNSMPTDSLREPAALVDVKGRIPWAVVLCRFNDLPPLSTPISQFNDFVAGAGKGGVFDYFKDVSFGTIDLTGSRVFGWYTMQYSFFKDGTK
ncbi:MAG TPA: hypothetical protein VFV34_05515, partial [Blastocatellia bacterium]|nr:hypothetical protein [Blastocatellia bacterium]